MTTPVLRNSRDGDFPSSPVVKTSPSNAKDAGSSPGQGAKISHASQPKSQNIKQKQYCDKFNRGFINGPHQKKNLKNNSSDWKKQDKESW